MIAALSLVHDSVRSCNGNVRWVVVALFAVWSVSVTVTWRWYHCIAVADPGIWNGRGELPLPFLQPFSSFCLPLSSLFPSLPSFPLELGPLNLVRVSGDGCKLRSRVWGAHPKSNLVHFSLKIWHLMATVLVIIMRVSRPNFVHFRTANAQKPSPKGEAAALSAYSWIRACCTASLDRRSPASTTRTSAKHANIQQQIWETTDIDRSSIIDHRWWWLSICKAHYAGRLYCATCSGALWRGKFSALIWKSRS